MRLGEWILCTVPCPSYTTQAITENEPVRPEPSEGWSCQNRPDASPHRCEDVTHLRWPHVNVPNSPGSAEFSAARVRGVTNGGPYSASRVSGHTCRAHTGLGFTPNFIQFLKTTNFFSPLLGGPHTPFTPCLCYWTNWEHHLISTRLYLCCGLYPLWGLFF